MVIKDLRNLRSERLNKLNQREVDAAIKIAQILSESELSNTGCIAVLKSLAGRIEKCALTQKFTFSGSPFPKTEENKKYCLYRHFAALKRQWSDGEVANFGEPCEECKLADDCKFDWEELLLEDQPKDVFI